MLEADSLAHGRLLFYRDAIDVVLEDSNWDQALRYADALDAFARPEPLLFAELVAARARALAALGRRGPEPEVLAGLAELRDEVRRAGYGGLATGIDAALVTIEESPRQRTT